MISSVQLDLLTTLEFVLKETLQCCLRQLHQAELI